MNCIEFESAVERAVETRMPLPSALLEHAARCAECQKLWEQQRQLDEAITAWRSVMPRKSLADAVLAELALPVRLDNQDVLDDFAICDESEISLVDLKPQSFAMPVRSATEAKQRSGLLALTSVAACMIVAVVFTSQYARRDLDPARNLASERPKSQSDLKVVESNVDVSSTLTAVFSDLQSEYRGMADETTAVAREMVNAIPHPIAVSVLPDSDPISLHPNPDDLGRMWKPIGAGVESAFGFLWQTVPSQVPSG